MALHPSDGTAVQHHLEPMSSVTVLQTQVLVIGTGISGLFSALKLAETGLKVILLTKNDMAENNSRYAQGGIAAVLPQNPEDSIELHVRDTLIAGAGLCNEDAVRSILADGYASVADLLLMGVDFDQTQTGDLALTLEGGHSVRRIIHAGGDATGRQVEMALLSKIEASPNIQHFSWSVVSRLFVEDGTIKGAEAINTQTQEVFQITADYTVLATGGGGRLYSCSTNPAGATGNGFALAYQAGCTLRDLEFVQFHPTAFFHDGQTRFLISEALRGEGGILRDISGEPFAHRYHPDGALAPRDVVTRAIFTEMSRQRELGGNHQHVYLDITHLPTQTIEARFPTILKMAESFGVDIRREWIPVSPAAHYMMGGVAVDLKGESNVRNLFVVGESVWTGLHGANRLASNSLLECLVLARRAAATIIERDASQKGSLKSQSHQGESPSLKEPLFETPLPYRFTEVSEIEASIHRLHQLMWAHVGVIREASALNTALEEITLLEEQSRTLGWEYVIPLGLELTQQLQVARLITEAALARNESRGAHYRSDYPALADSIDHSMQSERWPQQVQSTPCLTETLAETLVQPSALKATVGTR